MKVNKKVLEFTDALKAHSTQENFPRKENFFKCDCPTQIFRRKQILNIDIFGKFSVHGNHGNFSLVEMGFNM
jgi:hypothetical protein